MKVEVHLLMFLISALDGLSGLLYLGRLNIEEFHFESFQLKVRVFWRRDKFLSSHWYSGERGSTVVKVL